MAHRFINAGRSIPPFCPPALAASLSSLLWAYWTTLGEAAERWVHDPLYSHGFLVPVFAVVLLWARREQLNPSRMRSSWWGLPVLAAGVGMRLLGTYFHFTWLDAMSLLPCLAGLCLVLGGRETLKWSWPAVVFLAFMIPLPYRLGDALAGPLRSFATPVCTFILQTLGFPALAEGNRVLMNEVNLDIVGECSGLRMLVIFFALATAVVLVIQRPLWEKLLIVASAIPIAVVANVARITATGILMETASDILSPETIHQWAGWAMMPLGMALLGIELFYLKYLLLAPEPKMAIRPVSGNPPVTLPPDPRRRASKRLSVWPGPAPRHMNPTGEAS